MSEYKMAVVMVLDSVFPTQGGGGAETQVRTLGSHMRQRSLEVSVIVPMVAHGPQVEHDLVDGLRVRRIAYPRLPVVGALSMLCKLGWLLYRQRREYAVIHAHIASNMAAVSCVMGRLLGKPVIVKLTGMTEMLGGVLDPRPGPVARLRKVALRWATYYQATSSRIGCLLVDRGFEAQKVRLIPNAVDTARFQGISKDRALRERLCGSRRVVAVYAGRLVSEKGLELLLDGWARVFGHTRDGALVIVGNGALRKALEQRAARLGIEELVHFVGPTDSVETYLAIADFGVLTSLNEGLSNTLLEYMAAGLPVLGSRVSGTEDFVVPGRTGWLFEAGDVEGLVARLTEVAQAPVHELAEMGRNARHLVNARASIGSVVGQLASLYGVVPFL
ncbi:glycosyltransferase family 4 protein [Caldimonas aquatica]|uniref:Glycosyltransferase family 4 protein n=1 Tax=Caldimonas aquatica TaxID=376175 RepID=A0ABY6MW13_9BURK|nr:glycosyltransferase family 4 protein [Schlegelella aquatica]UZD56192.1 glycosyltransferase family 4 protein [Schlegelella aquatica]